MWVLRWLVFLTCGLSSHDPGAPKPSKSPRIAPGLATTALTMLNFCPLNFELVTFWSWCLNRTPCHRLLCPVGVPFSLSWIIISSPIEIGKNIYCNFLQYEVDSSMHENNNFCYHVQGSLGRASCLCRSGKMKYELSFYQAVCGGNSPDIHFLTILHIGVDNRFFMCVTKNVHF